MKKLSEKARKKLALIISRQLKKNWSKDKKLESISTCYEFRRKSTTQRSLC